MSGSESMLCHTSGDRQRFSPEVHDHGVVSDQADMLWGMSSSPTLFHRVLYLLCVVAILVKTLVGFNK